MEILKNNNNLKLLIDTEQNFRTDLGWEENFEDFEKEVLEDIINPAKNYETVRYIHRPYSATTLDNKEQCDIWFKFYFLSGTTYIQDYSADNVNITVRENEYMLRQSTESFFRLEFYKTPGTVTNGVLTCDPPTRQNRRLVNSKNLTLPLGEKFFYEPENSGFYIHLPIFTGSNYRNKENMYLFWFDDESTLSDNGLSGTTTLDRYTFTKTVSGNTSFLFMNELNEITQILLTGNTPTILSGATSQTFDIPGVSYSVEKRSDGSPYYHGMNTFFMTAKFFNGKDGSILDFTNQAFSTSHNVIEEQDMYYQVDFDNYERTYQIYKYSGGTKGDRVGLSNTNLTTSVEFYEKGGGTKLTKLSITPTPTPTPLSVTPTPTPLPGAVQYWYHLKRCDANIVEYSIRYNLNTFSVGQIVFSRDTKYYYTVTGSTATTSSNPGTPNITIDTSTYTRCEDTPYYGTSLNRSKITLLDMPFFNNLNVKDITDYVCGKTQEEIEGGTTTIIEGWVNGSPYVTGTTYTLYTTSTGSTIYVGGNRFYGVIENNIIKYVVFLSNLNQTNNLYTWRSCGIIPNDSCFAYINNTNYTSLVDYKECNTNNWIYSFAVAPYSGICAVYNTVTVLSGSNLTWTDINCKSTPTPTPTVEGATPTPTPTGGPSTATPTPTPTGGPATATPTPTPTGGPATATPTPTPTPIGYCYSFVIHNSSTLPSGYYVGYTPPNGTYTTTSDIPSYFLGDGDYQFYFCSSTTPSVYNDLGQAIDYYPITQGGACGVNSVCSPNNPTNIPTATPTPSPTATLAPGSKCISWSESSEYGLADGCGGNQRTMVTLTVQLKDNNGNSINATEIITVSFDATYSNELGNTATTITAQISNGSSSGVGYYSPQTYEIGPFSNQCTPESTTRDNDTPTITGSNSGTYTVC